MNAAGYELLQRYREALRIAWKRRRAMQGPLREPDELAFLPAPWPCRKHQRTPCRAECSGAC